MTGVRVGCCMTGSFCTFQAAFNAWRALKKEGATLIPIMSENAYSLDTRFYTAADARMLFSGIAEREIIHTLQAAEPIGPKSLTDITVVMPCTGNTMAKIAAGAVDTTVTMAVKSTLRNEKPVLIALSTNDGLGIGAKNIGALLALRNVFFVPFCQDDPSGKPRSLQSRFELLPQAVEAALEGRQLQPILAQTQ